jgi:Holliday junction resolvase
MGLMQRRKGRRGEQEVVRLHRAIDVAAERVPLSGAARYQGKSHDVDIYAGGHEAPLAAEVKLGRHVPKTLAKWLARHDALFVRRDRAEWMVVLPWRLWCQLVRR